MAGTLQRKNPSLVFDQDAKIVSETAVLINPRSDGWLDRLAHVQRIDLLCCR
jgi:hypothetical protein